MEAGFTVVAPKPPDEPCRSFAVWAPFPPAAGKSVAPKDMVWRIEKYLGAQRCEPPDRLAYQADEIDIPDVLLIEDLNLGFRDHERLWPKVLREGGANTSIVLRTCSALVDGPLWQRLLRHRDRLTKVVPPMLCAPEEPASRRPYRGVRRLRRSRRSSRGCAVRERPCARSACRSAVRCRWRSQFHATSAFRRARSPSSGSGLL